MVYRNLEKIELGIARSLLWLFRKKWPLDKCILGLL